MSIYQVAGPLGQTRDQGAALSMVKLDTDSNYYFFASSGTSSLLYLTVQSISGRALQGHKAKT